MTRRATAKQKAAHSKQVRSGRIPDPEIVQAMADALALADKAYDELTPEQRVLVRRVNLEKQSKPLHYRDRPAEPVWPTAPTPQFAAKHDIVSRPELGGLKSHRVKSIFESLQRHYSDSVLLALAKFYTDAETATRVNVTVNYDATGGGSPHGRMGGLGNVQERQRHQYCRHQRVIAALRSYDPQMVDIGRWLVLEVRNYNSEPMPNIMDTGRRLVPTVTDKATARGISIGSLLVFGWVLRMLYKADRLNHGDEYGRNYDEFEDPERERQD